LILIVSDSLGDLADSHKKTATFATRRGWLHDSNRPLLSVLPGCADVSGAPLLSLFPSVQIFFASFCESACLVVATSPPCELSLLLID
jgi:hypothetical protein